MGRKLEADEQEKNRFTISFFSSLVDAALFLGKN